jgi:hypothetical protein
MPKPTHVESFEKFIHNDKNEIRNYIAFGLFMESENNWTASRPQPPTPSEYKSYHENFLTPFELQRFKDAADTILGDFTSKSINSEQTKLLAENLRQYRIESSSHHQAFRRNGVKEAIFGAFWWTIILIVFSFILAFSNIDPIEYYHKARQFFQHETPSK